MGRKKSLIMGIAAVVILVAVLAGYNLYRYPAMLRRLRDASLEEAQVEELKEEILSRSDIRVLVA